MANNKVQLADGTTLIDLTEDTVTTRDLISGVTAHDRSGEIITGTFDPSIYIENSEKGAADGVAELDSSGKVPISQLPQINVNADWNASSGDAQILNKPANLVQDSAYVHTDMNYTVNDKNKVASLNNVSTLEYEIVS